MISFSLPCALIKHVAPSENKQISSTGEIFITRQNLKCYSQKDKLFSKTHELHFRLWPVRREDKGFEDIITASATLFVLMPIDATIPCSPSYAA